MQDMEFGPSFYLARPFRQLWAYLDQSSGYVRTIASASILLLFPNQLAIHQISASPTGSLPFLRNSANRLPSGLKLGGSHSATNVEFQFKTKKTSEAC